MEKWEKGEKRPIFFISKNAILKSRDAPQKQAKILQDLKPDFRSN